MPSTTATLSETAAEPPLPPDVDVLGVPLSSVVATLGIVGIAGPEVACQHVQPSLVEIGLDDVELCPRQPFRPPGIGDRVDTGCRGNCRLDHCPREWESEIGAHAVSATRGRTEPSR